MLPGIYLKLIEIPQNRSRGSCCLCWAWGHLARSTGHTEDRCCLFGVCEPLRDFRKVCGMGAWAKTGHMYGKATSWWDSISGNHQGGGMMLAGLLESQIWCQLGLAGWVGKRPHKGAMASASTSVSENAVLPVNFLRG